MPRYARSKLADRVGPLPVADACELIRAKSVKLGANNQALANLISGLPMAYNRDLQEDRRPLFDAVLEYLPPPQGDSADALQLMVSNLDYSDYLGRIAIDRLPPGKDQIIIPF